MGELQRDKEPSFAPVAGLSCLGEQKRDGACSLKLGRLGDFVDGSRDTKVAAAVSPSGSSKHSRGANNGRQTASCLADGCKSDLSDCRKYHRRHKVCEVHAKTPTVSVGGRPQRFCQQCSRFHSLEEFDEVKRSCRKHLDGHNRRRRKSQPNSLSTNSILFSSHQGSKFFSYQQMVAAPPDPTWAATVKTEEDILYPCNAPAHFFDHGNHFPVSFSPTFKPGKNFGHVGNPITASSNQLLLSSITSSNNHCALSLLSMPNQSSAIGLAGMVQSNRVRVTPSSIPTLEYDCASSHGLGQYPCSQASNTLSSARFSCSAVDEELGGSMALVPDGVDEDLHHQHIFQDGSGDTGPRENVASPAFPIFWQG